MCAQGLGALMEVSWVHSSPLGGIGSDMKFSPGQEDLKAFLRGQLRLLITALYQGWEFSNQFCMKILLINQVYLSV